MDAVGLEQRFRRLVVPFGLDALDLAEQPADAFLERPDVGDDVVGLVIAASDFDGARIGNEPRSGRCGNLC